MEDPIQSAIYDGIKRSINVCRENRCWGATVTLIYSGIDAMAHLGMREHQVDVRPDDFVAWCDRYLRLPGPPITGIEWYAARCAVVHTYGVRSKLSRKGRVRVIGYVDRAARPVIYNPTVSAEMIMVSIEALAAEFFNGVDRFLVELFADAGRREAAEKRLPWLLVVSPMQQSGDSPSVS